MHWWEKSDDESCMGMIKSTRIKWKGVFIMISTVRSSRLKAGFRTVTVAFKKVHGAKTWLVMLEGKGLNKISQ